MVNQKDDFNKYYTKKTETTDAEASGATVVIRRAILHINLIWFIDMITGKCKITNMPEGAIIVSTYFNYQTNGFDLVIEHDSFDVAEPGVEYPKILAECECV